MSQLVHLIVVEHVSYYIWPVYGLIALGPKLVTEPRILQHMYEICKQGSPITSEKLVQLVLFGSRFLLAFDLCILCALH